MRNYLFVSLLPFCLFACDGATGAEPDAGSFDASSSDAAAPAPVCPTPEPACELDAAADLTVDSLFTLALEDLVLAPGVDSVSLRIDGNIRAASGPPCSGASDEAACASAVTALAEPERAGGFANACALPNICEADLVVTRGDEVFAVSDVAGMLEVLGAIDAPAEAALVAFATRPPSGPSYSGYTVASVAAATGGYDVLANYLESDCTPIRSRHARLRVASDGAVTAACDRLASCTMDSCI